MPIAHPHKRFALASRVQCVKLILTRDVLSLMQHAGGVSVVPDLNGPVAVLDSNHKVLSVINVSVLLAAEQQLHPHDAIFLANGDIVVGTWAPGRVSYWKLLPSEDEKTQAQE